MKTLSPRTTACLALTLALLPGAAAADAVDDFVNAHRERHRLAGISVAIVRDGQLVKAAGYGLANVELGVPATPETVYQMGSVAKQFTALAVLLLVEEGKVGLEDPLTKYFPGAPKRWQRITVRHLLTHTSGIPDWERSKAVDYRRDYTEDELAKLAMKLPPDFAPGTQWRYSNTGYVLLGILAGRASGMFYGDFLEQRVFSPLGMDSTRIISEADIIPNRAAGYELNNGQLKNQEWVSPSLNTTADGSLYTTVVDLAKWDAALAAGRLLKPESYAAMWSPVRLADGSTAPYGFGWFLGEQRGERLVGHTGAWQGFRAAITRYLDRKLTVIVLTNHAASNPQRIATALSGLIEPALALPEVRSSAVDPDPAATSAMQRLLEDCGKGAVPPRLTAGLRARLGNPEQAKALRARVTRWLEKAQEFVYLAADDVAGRGLERQGEAVSRIHYYGLRGGEGALLLKVFLNGQGEVADFSSEFAD